MSAPVIVVFGAGTGLGTSVARRFGHEGYRVAVVGRRKERLDHLVTELGKDGIESAPFTADLSDPAVVPALLAAIRAQFGRIDVIEYGPVSSDIGISPATELTAEALQKLVGLFLLTPVEITRQVLPELTERGSGSVLFTHGATAVQAVANFSGPGTIQSGARHYLQSLEKELAGTGVYVGTVAITALIKNSDTAAITEANFAPEAFAHVPTVSPDDIADLYWDLHTSKARFEVIFPEATFEAPDFIK